MIEAKKYLTVILPLKFRGFLSYYATEDDLLKIKTGSWVIVPIKGKTKTGIVSSISDNAPEGIEPERIHRITGTIDRIPVGNCEIEFWKMIAEYYMCTVGEVFRAVFNLRMQREIAKGEPKRARKKNLRNNEPSQPAELSEAQAKALEEIRSGFRKGKPVLLKGVTGSGKTEIYIHLALETLAKGRSVLYLVPEIAISKQLQERLLSVFGDRLMVFHSKQTSATKRDIVNFLSESSEARIVLGTRSAVFLPFSNLGLTIVDEEHDHSYKQADPAPRYNGRDSAVMLSRLCGSDIVLGSATPSCESLFNVEAGKYSFVELKERFYRGEEPEVKVIDTGRERRLGNMRGSFSFDLLKEMKDTLSNGDQVLVFRSRRAYSPIVQCSECGFIPKCPKCNVSLSFHKYNYTLSCHYCGFSTPFTTRCTECGNTSLSDKGAGTEKLEEELKELFPEANIARFDAETTESKKREEATIRDFSNGKIDILVGTQMITKGFDFKNLSLVAVISADSLFAVDNFRSDETAAQLLTQLIGRTGRRGKRGRMIIQTYLPGHPVLSCRNNAQQLLMERKLFNYPPYVRMIEITVRSREEGRLWNACRKLSEVMPLCGIKDAAGPVTPTVDRINGQLIRQFWVKLPRTNKAAEIKKALYYHTEQISQFFKGSVDIIVDVDPL